MGRLDGKVTIITGGGRGIGEAYARRFAEEGAIVAVADIEVDNAVSVAEQITSKGGQASGHKVDISSMESTDALAAKVNAQHGGVDVLINNAAIYGGIDLEDNSPEYLQKIADVNLWGAWRMSRSVVPTMIERGGGRIINQSSDAAFMYNTGLMGPPPTELPNFSYGITKWGMNGLTKFMAGSLGPHKITVNCICPGVTMTEATKQVVPEHLISMLTMMVPLQRTLEPEDLTGTAVYFASSDADMVTGQIICVDGGMQMPT